MIIMKLLFGILLVFTVFLLVTTLNDISKTGYKSYASQCIGGITLEENYKNYDYIFSGKVISIDNSKSPTNVTLQVYNTWKGNTTQYMSLAVPFPDDPLYGFLFVEGQDYLIFSSSDNRIGVSTVNGCSPSGPLSQSHIIEMQLEKIKVKESLDPNAISNLTEPAPEPEPSGDCGEDFPVIEGVCQNKYDYSYEKLKFRQLHDTEFKKLLETEIVGFGLDKANKRIFVNVDPKYANQENYDRYEKTFRETIRPDIPIKFEGNDRFVITSIPPDFTTPILLVVFATFTVLFFYWRKRK